MVLRGAAPPCVINLISFLVPVAKLRASEYAKVISLLAIRFPVLILRNLGMLLTSWKNLILGKIIIFEKLPTFWKRMELIEKTLHTNVALKWVSFGPKCLVQFY